MKEKFCETNSKIKVPNPVGRQVIAPAGETPKRSGEGIAKAEYKRQQSHPAPAFPCGTKTKGNNDQIKNDQEQVIPFQMTVPIHPVKMNGLENSVIHFYQRKSQQAIDLGREKMIGDKPKDKTRILQCKLDQYPVQTLPLKIIIADIQIP